jgi:hypothetical protein
MRYRVAMTRRLVLKNGVEWRLSEAYGPPDDGGIWGAAVLASEMSQLPFQAAALAVRAAIEGRCGLIAVVAPNAEQIHDQIDDRLLEADEDTAVVTTWHADPMDAVWTVWASEGPVFVYTQSLVDLEKRLRTEGLVVEPPAVGQA